jgi:hypothetical protein
MRDLDALLGSLVNIDKNSLIALLSSESEAAKRVARSFGIEQRFSAPSDKKRRSEPPESTGFCRSCGMGKFQPRCLKVISQLADLLSKSCVFGASRNQIAALFRPWGPTV